MSEGNTMNAPLIPEPRASPTPSHFLQSKLKELGLTEIPAAPILPSKSKFMSMYFPTGGQVKVPWHMLHCDASQLEQIQEIYNDYKHFHKIFDDSPALQVEAVACLDSQNLIISELDDIGNGWSKRWSRRYNGEGEKLSRQRVLLQCQSGSSTVARQTKAENTREIKTNANDQTIKDVWKRKMPYDFTGCLAHLDITYILNTSTVLRITGILEHNEACRNSKMIRLPRVPLHPHVFQVALEQVNSGANIAAVQKRNQELVQAKLYFNQEASNPGKANYRYIFLPHDSRSLYRKQAASLGVKTSNLPAYNVDMWLDPDSPDFKPEIASAVFYYRSRGVVQERFKICIHTKAMKQAAWNFCHNNQLILDGTFGICDRRLLLFIAMGVDMQNKGVPLAFFLFSAPAGSQATHAGYDSFILIELLREWQKSMGTHNGEPFCPRVAITDTDIKERSALLDVWPHIILLLCRFHVRQCWTNKRKNLIKSTHARDFNGKQLHTRLRILEKALLRSELYENASSLIADEKSWLEELSRTTERTHASAVKGALTYINYLSSYWMQRSVWESWSTFGRITASSVIGITIEGVIPTTNHLEAFNGVLKHKYIHQYQKKGHRIRFDLLIFLLITHILPSIFSQRTLEQQFHEWLYDRFSEQTGGVDLVHKKRTRAPVPESSASNKTEEQELKPAVTWWSPDLQRRHHEETRYIISQKRISDFHWVDQQTIEATCASSLANIHSVQHTRYRLSLNCYGLSACTCLFNSQGFGACKHLWAFRFLLPSLSPTVTFYFPLTEKAAREIYDIFFPLEITNNIIPIPLPNAMTLAAQDIDSSLHFSTNKEDPSSILEASSSSEKSESDDMSEYSSDVPPNPSSTSRSALHAQLQYRIEREISSSLPALQNLNSLLNETNGQFSSSSKILEFQNTLTKLQETFSNSHQGTSINPSETTAGNRETHSKRSTSTKRRLIPPSPELKQKRQRSNGTY